MKLSITRWVGFSANREIILFSWAAFASEGRCVLFLCTCILSVGDCCVECIVLGVLKCTYLPTVLSLPITFLQSARCLHGRMKPLKGGSYSNLFVHFRADGDPQWYTRPNPENTPAQVLNIDHCTKVDGVVDCDGVKLPFLSPSKEVVRGPHDLYSYWERIGQAEEAGVKMSHVNARGEEL